MIRLFTVLFLLTIISVIAPGAWAHETRPGYLEIDQQSEGRYAVLWKRPALGEFAIRMVPHISNGWLEGPPTQEYRDNGFAILLWRPSSRGSPLEGRRIRIDGIEGTITDVIVHIRLLSGHQLDAVIRPDSPYLDLHLEKPNGLLVLDYLRLGVEHILTGIDHLMFVFGLLLVVGIRWRLIKAITAFTIAHSLTLIMTALGTIHLPPPIIEALVAFSIVFVAGEVARRDQSSLTSRYPWLIAFMFGLLHGMAFAGALAEVGLPHNAILLSLFLFNVGVEFGQLLFVFVAVTAFLALERVRPFATTAPWAIAARIPAYAIGVPSAFMFVDRISTAFA